MDYLQPYIYRIIRDLVLKRKEEHRFPYIASQHEITNKVLGDIKETIDEMEVDGILKHHKNINGINLYRIEKEEEDENNSI